MEKFNDRQREREREREREIKKESLFPKAHEFLLKVFSLK